MAPGALRQPPHGQPGGHPRVAAATPEQEGFPLLANGTPSARESLKLRLPEALVFPKVARTSLVMTRIPDVATTTSRARTGALAFAPPGTFLQHLTGEAPTAPGPVQPADTISRSAAYPPRRLLLAGLLF